MRIVSFNRNRLDAGAANGIQAVRTGAALAAAGAEVVLCADFAPPAESLLREMGAEPSPRLALRPMGWRWHRLALPLVAKGLLGGGAGDVLFLREVRPYALPLIRAARAVRMTVAFESHNAAGRTALDAVGLRPWLKPVPNAEPSAFVPHHARAASGRTSLPIVGGTPAETPVGVLMPGAAAPAATIPAPAAPPKALAPEDTPPEPDEPDPKAVAEAQARAALEAEILREADVLVAPQALTLEAVRDLLRPGTPAFVVPNAAPAPPAAPPRAKDVDILYIGSLAAWKGVDTLVAAMPRLYPWRLTVVGGREEVDRKRLQQMAVQLGVVARVTFVPPVRPAEVWDWYARAKVGVVPLPEAFIEAREYTCPIKLLEMMAAGLPVVASRLPSIGTIVRDGEEIVAARPDDPEDLAAAIRRVLEDGALAARLAAAGRARAAADFTYERRAARLLEAFTAARRA